MRCIARLRVGSEAACGRAVARGQTVASLPRLALRGLMTLPEPAADFAAQKAVHMKAKALFDELRGAGLALDTLSMGMTADLEAAIAAGSTMVRVGTAIFGTRPAKEDSSSRA